MVENSESGSRKMDKESFIKRIKEAEKSLASATLPDYTKADTTSTTATAGSAKEAFVRNFTNNHGNVFESQSALIQFLKDKGCKRGVADVKLADTLGLENEFELVSEFDRDNPEIYDFGISKASMAIGENGGIVLKDKDTADRMSTIAPWIHIAVLDESDILPTITDALEKTIDSPYAIWITGPSKTTDVEGVLVEGVHGPGVQICFIKK